MCACNEGGTGPPTNRAIALGSSCLGSATKCSRLLAERRTGVKSWRWETVSECVSECVDLYSAYSLWNTNALDALVTRGQVRFKETPKTVCAARWIPDKIRERVPGHRSVYRYFWAYPFLVFSFTVFQTHVSSREHVKIASRIVSYRIACRIGLLPTGN